MSTSRPVSELGSINTVHEEKNFQRYRNASIRKEYLPLKIVQKMYTSLIEPYFRYCYPVWGCTSNTTLQKLQKLQNRATRIATNSRYDASSEPFIQELGWLIIERLIKLETVKDVYKAFHNEPPHYMEEPFHKLSDTRSRGLRYSLTDLCIPPLKGLFGLKEPCI